MKDSRLLTFSGSFPGWLSRIFKESQQASDHQPRSAIGKVGYRRIFPFKIGRTGDVEVNPRGTTHEFLQKQPSNNAPGFPTPTNILDIGDFALDVIPVFIDQWQFPN